MSLVKRMLDRFSALGFEMTETMTGTHNFVWWGDANTPLFMGFSINWGPKNLITWLRGPQIHPLSGHITVEGLVCEVPCTGHMTLDYFGSGTIKYVIKFRDGYGNDYVYVGKKVNIKPWNLATSHTTCFGTLVDYEGRLVSRSVTHFKLGTAWKFLSSFRLT